MPYQYNNNICQEALRRLSSNSDTLQSRLIKAFAEMRVCRKESTTEGIWTRWKDLEFRYHAAVKNLSQLSKKHQQSQKTNIIYNEFATELLNLLIDWMKYNKTKLSSSSVNKS